MKALVVHDFENSEGWQIESFPMPEVGEKEVLLEVKAAGVSYIDALVAYGRYQVRPPLPYVPGTEFSGVVAAVGDGVRHLRVGDRVLGGGFGGGYGEYVSVLENSLFEIPDGMSFEQASVFRVSYLTAYHALVDRAFIQPNESLLVPGAAGAVGLAGSPLGDRVCRWRNTRSADQFGVVEGRRVNWR